MGERKRETRDGSCPVNRGTSEEMKEMRSRLRWVASLPLRTVVMSGPGLRLGPMSESLALM